VVALHEPELVVCPGPARQGTGKVIADPMANSKQHFR